MTEQTKNTKDKETAFSQIAGEEILSRRQENAKHFDLGNGRRQAILYPYAVHYRDEKGAMRVIDNHLEEVCEGGRVVLRNADSRLRVTLSKTTADGAPITLDIAGHPCLSWRFAGSEDAGLPVTNAAVTQGTALRARRSFADAQARRADLSDFESEVVYQNVVPGVSTRFALFGERVKQDVIVSSAEALESATLVVSHENAYLRVNGDQSVSVLDLFTNQTIFTFDPPLTYDAAGRETVARVRISEPKAEPVSVIWYELDDDFVNNAAWPITIDPSVYTRYEATAVKDAYIRSGSAYANTNYGSGELLYVGRESATDNKYALIRFENLIRLGAGDTVISAKLKLLPYSSAEMYSGCYLGAYPILHAWDENTVTYNNFVGSGALSASIGTELQDCISSTASGQFFLNITNLYRRWYTKDANGNSQNFGVAIQRPNTMDGTGDCKCRLCASTKDGYTTGPCVYVDYISHAGVQGWWTYESQSAGVAGTASVDLFNGNVVASFPDVTTMSHVMPASVSHHYNSCLSADAALTNSHPDFFCGHGWKLSLQQYIYSTNRNGYKYFVWVDEDATEHYFKQSDPYGSYQDEEGMGLTIWVPENTTSLRTITDRGNNELAFAPIGSDGRYWLTRITDPHGNICRVYYVSGAEGKIDYVIDAAHVSDSEPSKITFTYNIKGLLSGISTPGCPERTFSYASGRLIAFTDWYGSTPKSCPFAYRSGTNLLTQLSDYNMATVTLDYEQTSMYNAALFFPASATPTAAEIDAAAQQMCRCTSMIAMGGTDIASRQLFTYQHMSTEVTNVMNLSSVYASTSGSKRFTYQFNDAGNVVSVHDELGQAFFTKYDLANEDIRPSDDSCLQRVAVNRLRRADIQPDSLGTTSAYPWVATVGNASNAITRSTATRCFGINSISVVKGNAAAARVSQTVPLTSALDGGKTFTFSAYVKTTSLLSSSGGKAYLKLVCGSLTATSEVLTDTTSAAQGELNAKGWVRLHASLTLPTTVSGIVASFEVEGASGSAFMACPQLEEGAIVSRVNLLSNGSFRNATASGGYTLPVDWTAGAGAVSNVSNGVIAIPSDKPFPDVNAPGGSCLRLVSAPDRGTVNFEQTVYSAGTNADVFVLNGWAYAASLPVATAASRTFGFYVTFYYGSTIVNTAKYYFNEEHVGWQYACFAVKPTGSYTKVVIAASFTQNEGTALFTNLALYKERLGDSYVYNANKDLTSATDMTGTTGKATYDAFHNLIQYTPSGRPDTVKHTYTYGTTDALRKRHQQRSSASAAGVRTGTERLDNGQLSYHRLKNSAGTSFIKKRWTYTANRFKRLASVIDPAGNATGYTYNENSTDYTAGRLTKVTLPGSHDVNYAYDSLNRLNKVSTASDGKTYQSEYGYDDYGRVSEIKHNTTGDSASDVVLSVAHDGLGRQTAVRVGTTASNGALLSSTAYSAANGQRQSGVTYGNGDTMTQSYDSFNRVTGTRYEDSNTDQYSYVYGNDGQTGIVQDYIHGRTLKTEQDVAGRPSRAHLSDSAGTLYDVRTEYNAYGTPSVVREKVRTSADNAAFAATEYPTAYTYDLDDRPTAISYGAGTEKVEYAYEAGLGRLLTRKVYNGNTLRLTSTYSYLAGDASAHGTGASTAMVSQISQQGRSFAYAYDPDNNNITSVTRTDGLIGSGAATYLTQYVYDGVGQLVRVNDKTDLTAGANGTTWVFAYDRGGNILFKTAYPYATGTVGTAYRTYSFTYDTSWKDKLTKVTVNGADKAVSSDACGNITALTLPNGAWSLAWKHGSQLASMTKGSATVSFGYSHTGLRAYKSVTGADATHYTYNGSLLTHLRKGGNNLHFYYDAAGRPAFVDFNNTRYHYLHNLQGDIAGIVDATGTLVVSYAYDAWGAPTGTGGSLAGTLGALNPFRYRGYVYDDETGLYYLQARYYNPEWGRFISADALMGDVGTLLKHNLFAYCANNSIRHVDKNGKESIDITERLNEEMRSAYLEIAGHDILPFGVAEAIFYKNVKSGGKWDLKTRADWDLKAENTYIYDGIELRFDEPGNIMFGYVGSRLFGIDTLRLGAGLYQQYQGHSDSDWSKGWPNFGDDPIDSDAIEYGYRLRKRQNIDLSIFKLYDLIRFSIYDRQFRRKHEKDSE